MFRIINIKFTLVTEAKRSDVMAAFTKAGSLNPPTKIVLSLYKPLNTIIKTFLCFTNPNVF